MRSYFILAQSDATAQAIEQVLMLSEKVGKDGESHSSGFASRVKDVFVNDGNELDSPAGVVAAFRRISSVLEQSVVVLGTTATFSQTLVLVDEIHLERLNPIEGDGWNTLVAMLILAFPEVRFLFGVCHIGHTEQAKEVAHHHTLGGLFSTQWEALFDSTGLRTWVRANAREIAGTPTAGEEAAAESLVPYLPVRPRVAAAVDDESSYAYFHGYTAYRFGFRSYVITGFDEFAGLFGKESDGCQPPNCDLVLDDLFLNFPDREPLKNDALPLSDLRQRVGQYPRVAQAAHWIFITTGQRRPGDDEQWKDNEQFLRDLRDQGQHNKMLFKPTSGIFDLWTNCGLLGRLPGCQNISPDETKVRRGYAPGFVWPPSAAATAHDLNRRHSAPGRMLEISTRLIARAERMLEHVTSVPAAVHGAVLATDALELIGPRTPTTSLEALSLKHQFEVIAECQFHGVEYDFDLRKRFADIKSETDAMKSWFNPKTGDRSLVNAQLAIASRLVLVFRNFNQFDEEHVCLNKVRDLHRKAWVQKRDLNWLIWPFRWYFDTLLKSLTHFTAAILIWLALLSVLYAIPLSFDSADIGRLANGFVAAYTSFFPMQPPNNVNAHFAVVALAILGGFLHLGAFASHLYSKIARK